MPVDRGGAATRAARVRRVPAACIALLAVVVALLAGCGGGGDDTTTTATTAAPAPATGATLPGTGYTVRLPQGWRDAGDEDTGLLHAPDLVVASEDPPGVVIVTIDKQAKGVSAAELTATLKRSEVQRAGVTGAADLAAVTLDGTRGVSYRYDTTNDSGTKLRTRQVVVVRGRRAYTAALTAPAAGFAAPDRALSALLASWRWTAAATG